MHTYYILILLVHVCIDQSLVANVMVFAKMYKISKSDSHLWPDSRPHHIEKIEKLSIENVRSAMTRHSSIEGRKRVLDSWVPKIARDVGFLERNSLRLAKYTLCR